jgi:hypothetical protein
MKTHTSVAPDTWIVVEEKEIVLEERESTSSDRGQGLVAGAVPLLSYTLPVTISPTHYL